LRGGNWSYRDQDTSGEFLCRASCRNFTTPTTAGNSIGFRSVLPLGQ
jgi:formylglycine-generating enzyme required for sulfatase activity